MTDERPGRMETKNSSGVGREYSRRLRLPKSDLPSIPESRIKPGSDKPT